MICLVWCEDLASCDMNYVEEVPMDDIWVRGYDPVYHEELKNTL